METTYSFLVLGSTAVCFKASAIKTKMALASVAHPNMSEELNDSDTGHVISVPYSNKMGTRGTQKNPHKQMATIAIIKCASSFCAILLTENQMYAETPGIPAQSNTSLYLLVISAITPKL